MVISVQFLDEILEMAATGMLRTDLAIGDAIWDLIEEVADRRALTPVDVAEAHRLRDLMEASERLGMAHEGY